jgi:hypothetical protein
MIVVAETKEDRIEAVHEGAEDSYLMISTNSPASLSVFCEHVGNTPYRCCRGGGDCDVIGPGSEGGVSSAGAARMPYRHGGRRLWAGRRGCCTDPAGRWQSKFKLPVWAVVPARKKAARTVCAR